MNRRDLLMLGAAALVPAPDADALPYLGDMTYRAMISDGTRITCYEGIDTLMERVRPRLIPQVRDSYVWKYVPHIRFIERWDRDSMRWVFYAGSRSAHGSLKTDGASDANS